MRARGGTWASAQAKSAGNTAQADQYQHTADSALDVSSKAADSASSEVRSVLNALMGDSYRFRGSISQEMTNVEGGRSFLPAEVTSYLGIAEDRAPFLPLLTEFCATKPPVRTAAEAYVATPDASSLSRLGDVLGQYEIWVAQNERARP